MPETVIVDSSCLIVLRKIQELDVLHELYEKIIISSEVNQEVSMLNPDWVEVREVKNTQKMHELSSQLDIGEASSIALALETEFSLLVIDDLKARKAADKLLLRYTGTLGIIYKLKEKGIISSLKPILTKLQKTNFRISPIIIEELLKLDK